MFLTDIYTCCTSSSINATVENIESIESTCRCVFINVCVSVLAPVCNVYSRERDTFLIDDDLSAGDQVSFKLYECCTLLTTSSYARVCVYRCVCVCASVLAHRMQNK